MARARDADPTNRALRLGGDGAVNRRSALMWTICAGSYRVSQTTERACVGRNLQPLTGLQVPRTFAMDVFPNADDCKKQEQQRKGNYFRDHQAAR